MKARKGIYVYCLANNVGSLKTFNQKGVDFAGNVFALQFKDIIAIVSEVDIDQYNEEKINDLLLNNNSWAKKNIIAHHKIISLVYDQTSVVPMRFGLMFKSQMGFEQMLKANYAKFNTMIKELKNKEEWGVKIYLNQELFGNQLKEKDKELKKLQREVEKAPLGKKWYLENKINEKLTWQIEKEVETYLEKSLEILKINSRHVVVNNTLPKETTKTKGEMVLNSACLVEKNKLPKFKKSVSQIKNEFSDFGLFIETTGPWPPYNFIPSNRS